jgi:hypothetical protein
MLTAGVAHSALFSSDELDGRSSFTPINKTGGLMLVPHPPQKRDGSGNDYAIAVIGHRQ